MQLSLKQSFRTTKKLRSHNEMQGLLCLLKGRRFYCYCFTEEAAETKESNIVSFIVKIAANFFPGDKHLIIGVSSPISIVRNRPDYCLIYDEEAKEYKVEITQATLFVNKVTVSDNIYSAIETTISKTPLVYRYTEIITKTFLTFTGSKSWDQKDSLNSEPIRKFAVAITTNKLFLATRQETPYRFKRIS